MKGSAQRAREAGKEVLASVRMGHLLLQNRRFAEADVDPVAAGRQLEVDAVLDGRLQREGDRLRLTLQLVPTSGGTPLWADRFDEEFTHLFALEDKVAERVRKALDEEPVGLAIADEVVVNDDLQETVEQLLAIIDKHRAAPA